VVLMVLWHELTFCVSCFASTAACTAACTAARTAADVAAKTVVIQNVCEKINTLAPLSECQGIQNIPQGDLREPPECYWSVLGHLVRLLEAMKHTFVALLGLLARTCQKFEIPLEAVCANLKTIYFRAKNNSENKS
jgi:hypothetical protein